MSEIVCSPRHHRAVASECEVMQSPSRDGDHIAQCDGHIRLAISIRSPSNYSAVAPKGDAMRFSSRDCHHVAEPCRHIRLAPAVIAPAGGAAIVSNGEAMDITCSDSYIVGFRARYRRPSRFSPADHNARHGRGSQRLTGCRPDQHQKGLM